MKGAFSAAASTIRIKRTEPNHGPFGIKGSNPRSLSLRVGHTYRVFYPKPKSDLDPLSRSRRAFILTIELCAFLLMHSSHVSINPNVLCITSTYRFDTFIQLSKLSYIVSFYNTLSSWISKIFLRPKTRIMRVSLAYLRSFQFISALRAPRYF